MAEFSLTDWARATIGALIAVPLIWFLLVVTIVAWSPS